MDDGRSARTTSETVVRLLGPVEVEVGGALRELAGPKARTVLAALALRAGHLVPTAELTAAVWGAAAPGGAPATLRSYVSRLRTAALGERIVRDGDGYRLSTEGLAVDLAVFDELRTRARAAAATGSHEEARGLLGRALACWRGRALSGTTGTDWIRGEASRLEELRLDAAELRAELLLRAGDVDLAVAELRDAWRTAPFRESLVGSLMLALYRRGSQADALEVYAHLRRRMARELGVEPGAQLRRIHTAVLAHDSGVLGSGAGATEARATAAPGLNAAAAGGNLRVPLTSFVGRAEEIEVVHELLDQTRLLTLTGPGGCGKTRLAVEAARRLPTHDLDGPWLVELAELTQPGLVAPAVAQTLGVSTQTPDTVVGVIAAAVTDRPVLLLLDGCEHLLDDVAGMCATLLQRRPGLQVLATSREPLGVPGERVLTVPSLSLRARGGQLPDAVRLLVERARNVAGDFAVDESNQADVLRLCRELDGIPLAIELAAARLAALSVADLVSLLDDRFSLLQGTDRTSVPRHRTLEAAVEWSYRLLDDEERGLYTLACVFSGGFTLDALTRVAGRDAEPARAAGVLSSLVSKSMVVAGDGDNRRYHLLRTLRGYGLRQLPAEAGHRLRDRHARWAAELAEAADAGLRGPEERRWVERLALEQDNLRAAMEHSLAAGEPLTALRIAAATHWYWYLRGHIAEGCHWIARALAAAPDAAAATRAAAHGGLGLLRYLAGDVPGALAAARAAMELADEASQPDLAGYVCATVGFLEAALGDAAAAERLAATFDRLLTRDIAPGTRALIAIPLSQMARAGGDLDEAERLAERGQSLALELGYRWAADSLTWILAKVLMDRDRPLQAVRQLATALRRATAHGDRTGTLACLHTLAGATAGVGLAERGATLLGAVDTIGERIGYNPLRMDPVDGARGRDAVAAALTPEHFSSAYARGRGLSPSEAVSFALAAASVFEDSSSSSEAG